MAHETENVHHTIHNTSQKTKKNFKTLNLQLLKKTLTISSKVHIQETGTESN